MMINDSNTNRIHTFSLTIGFNVICSENLVTAYTQWTEAEDGCINALSVYAIWRTLVSPFPSKYIYSNITSNFPSKFYILNFNQYVHSMNMSDRCCALQVTNCRMVCTESGIVGLIEIGYGMVVVVSYSWSYFDIGSIINFGIWIWAGVLHGQVDVDVHIKRWVWCFSQNLDVMVMRV